jgi:SAM-dependent methyltransferase
MITNKEINFPAYNQTFKFFKLDLFSRVLVNTLRLFKINTTAYKLDFFERMLNFIRIVGLEIFSNNVPVGQINKPIAKLYDVNNDNEVSQPFVEFLYHFGILIIEKGALRFNGKYKRLIEDGHIKKIVNSPDNPSYGSLTKAERKMVHDFLFIRDMIKKYGDPGYVFRHVDRNKRSWELLITEKKLDYEVRLCETLYNLRGFKMHQKIKSPFDEDYYTESGQNAFKNFTRFVFSAYLKKINTGNTAIHVFDLGCGYGNYIEEVHNAFPGSSITGIELNPVVYSATKKKFEGVENIEIIHDNFFHYPANKKFDALLMNYVLFYFNSEEKKKVFEKAKEMIADNGSIILCQYFSGIENLKKALAEKQNDYSVSRKIEMFYSNKILYANTLWNDAADTFSEAVKWNEFQTIISESGLYIRSMVNADKFYYSFFIELKKNF